MRLSASLVASLAASIVSLAACASPTDEAVGESQDAIVGGTEAEPDAWPGTAALYKSGTRPSCGASLIHPSWVLTAAHCVSTTGTGGVSQIVIGRRDLSTTDGETRTVDRVIRHEEYRNLDNDIALLHLTEPSTLPTVQLPSSAQLSAIVEDAETTVVGWGRTGEGGTTSDVLRQVTVPIISNPVCKAFSGYSRVTDNMICAGTESGGLDSCQGDSGGPLFMKIDGAWVEIGLVSWGVGCARPNQPGVYTRLGNYLGWMFEKTDGDVGEASAAPPAPAPEPTPAEPTPTDPTPEEPTPEPTDPR